MVDMVTRRQVMASAGGALVAAMTAGCELLSSEPAVDGNGKSGDRSGAKEAPDLAARVESGNLPRLSKRLPAEPLVVEPVDRIGTYGGTWQTALLGPADTSWLSRTMGYEGLVRWSPDWSEIIPDLAESFEANTEGTEFRFRIRPGIKWSDGEAFTADDVVFAQNDIYNNEEILPAEENRAMAEKVDDHTVMIRFERPNGLFLQEQATGTGADLITKPRHYLERFHEKYNPDIDQLVQEEGFEDWVQLIDSKAGISDSSSYWMNPDIPTLFPWMVSEPLGAGSRLVAVRNPYYWKVDPNGRQLPYIDSVVFELVQDAEVMLTKALNGELSMHVRHFNTLQNKPVLARNRQSGDYRFFETRWSDMNTAIIALNLTHQDAMLREIFNNRDFRIGLSHAIDRQEIIDLVYQKQGEPWQTSPRPESDLYDEEMAKQYIEYDPDLANRHLDRAGYSARNDEDIRLGPDETPISFTIDFAIGSIPEWMDVLELVREYWLAIGIDARIRQMDRSLFYERKEANQHDANIWGGGGGWKDAFMNPIWYFPFNTESNYAIPWAQWYTSGGQDGEEPPEPTKKQMDIFDNGVGGTTDEDEQIRLMRDVIAIAKEQFYVIGINLTPPGFGIVGNDFHNVPESMPFSSPYPTPGPTNPEQYFIDIDAQ